MSNIVVVDESYSNTKYVFAGITFLDNQIYDDFKRELNICWDTNINKYFKISPKEIHSLDIKYDNFFKYQVFLSEAICKLKKYYGKIIINYDIFYKSDLNIHNYNYNNQKFDDINITNIIYKAICTVKACESIEREEEIIADFKRILDKELNFWIGRKLSDLKLSNNISNIILDNKKKLDIDMKKPTAVNATIHKCILLRYENVMAIILQEVHNVVN